MSATNIPEAMPAPAHQPPAPRRGFGSMRSMVISLVVIMVAVLAWVLMVPRVRDINQPAVDVTSVAAAVRQESGWAISQPQLPAGWKATSVRFDAVADPVKTWHAGYLSPDGHYVSMDQTAVAGATSRWISGRISHGQADGILSAAGMTWQKFSSEGVVQRSLVSSARVSKGSGGHEVTTVLSGTAPYAQLVQFAEAMKPVPVS
ncbi:MAG: hypothetical protein QOE58_3582 [Actinomycetota bacterium]|nr:hypothetical protein [Actinomycetota bacterium]